jgi:hypothetical protein
MFAPAPVAVSFLSWDFLTDTLTDLPVDGADQNRCAALRPVFVPRNIPKFPVILHPDKSLSAPTQEGV